MLQDCRPLHGVDVDLEKARDALDLAAHVRFQIVEVDEQHVRQPAEVPPTLRVLPEPAEFEAREVVELEKMQVVVPHVARRVRDPWTNAARHLVECVERFSGERSLVVVGTPDDVAGVAADVDILRPPREHERVDRQVRLDESTMLLRFELRHQRLEREDPHVEPRRAAPGRDAVRRAEQQLADDLLHPRRPGLAERVDDDIVRAKLERVPARRVDDCGLDLASLFRPGDLIDPLRRLLLRILLRHRALPKAAR